MQAMAEGKGRREDQGTAVAAAQLGLERSRWIENHIRPISNLDRQSNHLSYKSDDL